MDEHRDRSGGWKHAKLSGHSNEELVCLMLKNDASQQRRILEAINKPNARIIDCYCGGLHETNVPSVVGGTTKNKADLIIKLNDGQFVGISIKKSLNGQVFLIKEESFIRGFELQYGKTIPADVRRAISLFWGSANDTVSIINSYGREYREYELRKHRLTAQTLRNYNQSLSAKLLDWFRDNIYNIVDYCFARGQARNASDRALIVWYVNLLGEHNIDEIYHIDSLCSAAESNKGVIIYGTKGGGTTINLPFGFVQWHQKSMQFHHKHSQIGQLNVTGF